MTRITPRQAWLKLDLRGVWAYRELLLLFLMRDIRGQYRQMALGSLWILIKPVMSMLVFTGVFGGLVRVPSSGLPYPLFFFSALLPWSFFSTSLAQVASSLRGHMHLISKVYFPRLVVPIAATSAALVDLAVAFVLLLGMTLAWGFRPGWPLLMLPVYVALAAGAALSVGLWVAALSVKFRDLAYVLNYGTQAWMYLSPVIYPSSVVPERWKALFYVNPMAHVIDGFRWCLFGVGEGPGPALAVVGAGVVAVLLLGACHFQYTERAVVDLL